MTRAPGATPALPLPGVQQRGALVGRGAALEDTMALVLCMAQSDTRRKPSHGVHAYSAARRTGSRFVRLIDFALDGSAGDTKDKRGPLDAVKDSRGRDDRLGALPAAMSAFACALPNIFSSPA